MPETGAVDRAYSDGVEQKRRAQQAALTSERFTKHPLMVDCTWQAMDGHATQNYTRGAGPARTLSHCQQGAGPCRQYPHMVAVASTGQVGDAGLPSFMVGGKCSHEWVFSSVSFRTILGADMPSPRPTMNTQTPLQLAQQYLAKMGADPGPDDMAARCVPDLAWHIPGDTSALPWIGEKRGSDALADFIRDGARLITRECHRQADRQPVCHGVDVLWR